MELSRNILCKMNVPTKDLKVETVQELLILVRNTKSKLSKEFWEEAAIKLWQHLQLGLCKLDDQLLCATCFYSVIILADKENYYHDEILCVFSTQSKIQGSEREMNEKDTYRIVSLTYGMFQSSYLIQTKNRTSKMAAVLEATFNVLLKLGYEYSQYAFLVFKTIKSFKKVCGGPLEYHIFCKENQVKLLALVNNNWENPLIGIRDLNRSIFQNIISTLDQETYESVLKEIEGFYWNKAKFLMFSEIIESYKGDIKLLANDMLVDGLIYSLYKPGLVSAGADMYYALLKKINNQNYWCQLFLKNIIEILDSSNTKAIENFTNYWCLTTMKKFSTLTSVLNDELDQLVHSENLLYSKLCIMKQANKLGIIDKNFHLPPESIGGLKSVLTGIEHCNVHIRIQAFDILCVSQGKSVPSQLEYNLILNYLHDNVNSDSTVLRLGMLNSFNTFLIQLHFRYLNVMIKNENSEDIGNLITFCKALQYFISNNLNGNYQRKITSAKLCNCIITNFSDIPKKRKDQTKQANVTLIGFLKENNHWLLSTKDFIGKLIYLLKDPSDDVRENVVKILLNHYVNDLQDVTIMSHIVNDAKRSLQSKFFYEISCGHSMFKLITNLIIREEQPIAAEFKNVEDIFNFACSELITEFTRKTNVLESIESGKQLHSFMSILIVVLEESILNSYKINIDDRMSELLYVLENISNQFAWEEEGSCDFSKINDLVQNIIINSDCNSVDQNDHTKISGLQQIVLNCLWLSVKASCDLASILLQYNNNNVSMCEKCLNIITRVLETSRHKGAIEAAGAALGRGIQYLTSLPDKRSKKSPEEQKSFNENVSQLPFSLLERKLNELISETNKMSSITRRGAGLSIMVHRIVSSDMKKGKPLFHYFIKTLLHTCNNQVLCTIDDIDNQVDLPIAIYIHFMTRIVTDSSLATDMMYYSVELAELAFRNLTSSYWQIRNAALQLYGALIPRLIGQKKASGTDEETIATVACDELRTHLPKLWQYVTEQIKPNSEVDIIQHHSNLVPILSMLASSAKRYNFTLYTDDDSQFKDLFPNLILLLSSPICTVRRLTAKTIFNIYEFEFISNKILQFENIKENQLHGLLLLINICHKYYSSDAKFENVFRRLNDKFCQIFSCGTHSYLSKKLYEDVYVNDIDIKDVETTIMEINGNVRPGVHNWAEARLKKFISKCSWNDIPSLLKTLLQQCDHEQYCKEILLKLETQKNSSSYILIEIANILLKLEKQRGSIIWQIIYEISQQIELKHINVRDLLKKLDGQVSYNLRYMVPLVARNIGNASVMDQTRLLNIIEKMSDFESSDVNMRYIASIANNELAEKFNKMPDSLKVISIKCAVLLLQDEDEDVRNLTVKFYSILSKNVVCLQPYICLNKMISKSFLSAVFDEPQSIQELSTKLNKIILSSKHKIDEYNPFANDSKNIYFEPDVLKQIVDNLNRCIKS